MTYDSRTWTGRYPVRHFPHVVLELVTPWFGVRIGPWMNWDSYGIAISWGRVPPAPLIARHEHFRYWPLVTAEQLMNRA